jgi:hypothetical protein
MPNTLVTMKTSPRALALLRLAAKLSGEKHYALMERLLNTEVRRLKKKRRTLVSVSI